ncbi:hypothetical protein ACF0H5_015010 [Mactra antiquata]
MRTIKDPKKKPELRRRPDPSDEELEEEDRSIKSTPPKKRRTGKTSKDDSSSINDSSSLIDNQSDILSERSSIIGDDDVSDISSLKSTPPKKRNYNRIVSKSPEVNGDAALDDHIDSSEKKTKSKKKSKNTEGLSPVENDTTETTETSVKKSPKAKKKILKDNNIEATNENHETNNVLNDKDKSVSKKKPPKKNASKAKSVTAADASSKKKAGRKRKLSGATNEENPEGKEDSSVPKKGKKTKKQLQKEAQTELKRQTEELRKSQAEKTKEGADKDVVVNNVKPTKKKSPKKQQVNNAEQEKVANHDKSETKGDNADNEDKPVENDEPVNSRSDLIADDDDSDDSSDLDTSFDTINGDQRDNLDDSLPDNNVNHDKVMNGSIDNDSSKVEQCIKCDLCGYISKSKGGHTRHLRKCQPEKLGLEPDLVSKPKCHKCEQCEYTAPKRVLVINHMRTHGIFQCKRCQFRTDNEDTLEEHSALEHKDRSDCKFCKNCNRYVKCSEITLEKHMEECQGRIPFKCPECSKEFQYESSLKCHVVSHYPDQPKLFSCDQCDYKSNYKANLKKHIRHIHEQRGERNVKCTECDKLFYTEDNMKRHLKLHSEEKPHKCDKDDCGKTFKTINGLKFHMLSHQIDRPYACKTEGCDRSFKTSRALGLHLNEFHKQAAKNYKCTEEGCDMAFYKKSHLDRHIDAHKDNRTHFCLFITCTKAFRTAEALKVHTRVHTDEKPLKCEHCDYRCRQKSSITFHMKKKHPDMLPNDLASPKPPTTGQDSERLTSDDITNTSIKGEIDSDYNPALENNRIGVPLNSSEQTVETNKYNSIVETGTLLSSTPLKSSSHNENPSSDTELTTSSADKNVPLAVVDTQSSSKKISGDSSNNDGIDRSRTEVQEVKDPPGGSSTNKTLTKPKKTDLYEFQSEDESGDEMRPGLLRKDFDKDKPPLPPVNAKHFTDLVTPIEDVPQTPEEPEKSQKVRKKPGPKPKPKPEKSEEEEVKVPKKRGRKKKSETQKETEEKSGNQEPAEATTSKKAAKPGKRGRGRSPKAKKEEKIRDAEDNDDDDDDDDDEAVPVAPPKRKGRPPKKKAKEENPTKKVPKKRGRKKKVDKDAESNEKNADNEIVPENGDATINYSEVESNEFFGDSTKDSMPDTNEMIPVRDDDNDNDVDINTSEIKKTIDSDDDNVNDNIENEVENDNEANVSNKNDDDVCEDKVEEEEEHGDGIQSDVDENEEQNLSKDKIMASENKAEEKMSDTESSDIGSDFDEDLKPPPAPRPPPMYDSEDGDIESGPENEDFNGSAMSNEPLRDFESSREISREISRDFESSRENIDDSVKTNEYINSVETSTPKDTVPHSVGTPGSANPYTRNDSVTNEHENPLSHHSSVPHTPSHNSVPPTPSANQEYPESRTIDHPGDRIIKTPVQGGQTNEENTDESSMPEVDKDYVGRFFEEIQCTQVQTENQINRMSSLDENTKSQDKIVEAPRSDSGVPSSLTSNQTESSIQMQSPPADLSHKRLDLISPDRVTDPHYQPRSESVHNRSSERIPSVPSFDPSYTGPIDSYSSPLSQRDSILRQPEPSKAPSPPSTSTSFMRFPESEAMLQRQRVTAPYDRNLQNLHRIAEGPLPQHNSSSPLLRHVPGREEMFSGAAAAGVAGSMARNPFHGSWPGQDVRPTHWTHPTYLQQQSGSASSSLFGKDTYLPGREFMFDPARGAADRNMFSSLSSAHSQRPELPHDTFQFDRFDLGSYLSSHGYNAAPSLPVDYTRGAHSSSQKSLDERYRQPSTGITDFRTLPPTSSASEMFGMNSTFNFEKFYSREPMYHSQHITDNTNNPFLPGVPSQHSMFGRDYPHRGFYTQNAPYPFMNMNDKNYSSASAKLGHSTDSVTPQRDLVPVPRPNMSAPDAQLPDSYRHHHSSMLYNMMNKYF